MPFQVNTVKKSEILGRSSMQNLVSNKRIHSKLKWCLKNIKTVCQTDVLQFTGYYTNCKVSQSSHLLSTPGNCLGTWIRHLGQKFPLAVSNETSNHQASPLMLKEDFQPLYLLLSEG